MLHFFFNEGFPNTDKMTDLSDVVPGGAGRAIRELRVALPGEALIGANQSRRKNVLKNNQ